MTDGGEVMLALRRNGIAVLHTAEATSMPTGRGVIVVFLESARGQTGDAMATLRRLAGVADVTLARHSRAILYVQLEHAASAPGPFGAGGYRRSRA